MRKIVLLTTAATLIASLALAQAYGPRANHQPARMAQSIRMQGSAGLAGELQGVVASLIGLPADEVHVLKQDGASFASIAAERGVDTATVEAAYLAAREGVIAKLLETEAITEQQAEQMASRGAAAFVALFEREGCGEGQNVTGERLFANRAGMARGPQLGDLTATSQRHGRGPQARW